MRQPHWLTPNKKNEQPQHLIFYDTETIPEKRDDKSTVQRLVLGWAAYVTTDRIRGWEYPVFYRFNTISEFWAFVLSKTRDKTRLYLFAHNQSFDFTVTQGFSVLRKRRWKLRKAIIEGPPTILSFRRGKRTIAVLDTLNYFRVPLKTLGEAIGITKGEMPEQIAADEKTSEYCKQDVTVILRAMQFYLRFLDENDLGNFQPTLASQAFAAYRHRFMQAGIFIDCNEQSLEISRAAYTGGRTETFYIGAFRRNLHLLDVNSMYPAVMRDNLFPNKLVGVYRHVEKDALKRAIRKFCVCGFFEVSTPVPVFPMRHSGRLIFPIGTFGAYLSTPEIEYALRNNLHIRAIKVAVYNKADIFSEFVNYFYSERLKFAASGNTAFAYFMKIMMNSLYGKFGQSGRVFDECGKTDDPEPKTWDEIDAETNELTTYRQLNGVIYALSRNAEARDSFPAIAAHVTSYARMLLWSFIMAANRGNVFYVDTDSLLVNDAGLSNLQRHISARDLGKLKYEASYDAGEIRAPKDYRWGDKERIKGVRKNAVKLAENVYEQDTFGNFKGMLRAGNLDEMVIRRTTKHLARIYKKGKVGVDGRVSPFRVNQPQS